MNSTSYETRSVVLVAFYENDNLVFYDSFVTMQLQVEGGKGGLLVATKPVVLAVHRSKRSIEQIH